METGTLEAMAKGDQHAFAKLYDEFAPTLYGVALRIAASEEKATQMVQEAFRKIWRNASAFDPAKHHFITWALGFLKQVATEQQRPPEQPAENFDFLAFQAANSVAGDASKLPSLERYMDEKHRKVIELAFFQGLSEQEIEETMHIPVGTVNTRLRFSLRELRKFLEENSLY